MTGQDYTRAWADYKRRRLAGWLLPLALLLGSWGIRNVSDNAPLVLFVLAFVAWFALQAWYERWPCPRCGKRFTEPGKAHTSCTGCGLEKAAVAAGPSSDPSSDSSAGLQ